MIIVPYVHSKTEQTLKNIVMHRITILCQGGCTLWTEDDQSIKNILEPNGLISCNITIHTINGIDYTFVKVDPEHTDMKSMYTWNEIPLTDMETLCWRSFYVGVKESIEWLPAIADLQFNPILSDILKTECVI